MKDSREQRGGSMNSALEESVRLHGRRPEGVGVPLAVGTAG